MCGDALIAGGAQREQKKKKSKYRRRLDPAPEEFPTRFCTTSGPRQSKNNQLRVNVIEEFLQDMCFNRNA